MRDRANSYKDCGNSLFSQKLFDEAIAQYSLALDSAPPQDPGRSTFFNNRAACFQSKASLLSCFSAFFHCALLTFAKGDFDQCISDCTDSLKVSLLLKFFHLYNGCFHGCRLILIIWSLCCVEQVGYFKRRIRPTSISFDLRHTRAKGRCYRSICRLWRCPQEASD